MTRRTWLACAPLAVLATPRRAAALGFEIIGNEPWDGGIANYPAGVLAVINQPARVYMTIGGAGMQVGHAYFAGGAAAANTALALFAKVVDPKRAVWLAAGPGATRQFDKKPVPFDFTYAPHAGRSDADRTHVLCVRLTAASEPAADVKALTDALDSPRFADRDAATRELARLGRTAKPGLRAARAVTASAEVRGRIDSLLAKLTGTDVSDLVMPAGLPVFAAEEPEKPETKTIRDDVARFVAARTK